MKYNILIVGVGGQGTLLASRVLGSLANELGLDCKLSEVHGMAQRGGSVVTHAKIADKVYSPIITEGEADFIVAFEKLEAARWRHYIKKGGIMLVNEQEIYPMPVIVGDVEYPCDTLERIKNDNIETYTVDALAIAREAGNIKALNTVMIGMLAKVMKIEYNTMLAALEKVVPKKLLSVNVVALEKGFNLI